MGSSLDFKDFKKSLAFNDKSTMVGVILVLDFLVITVGALGFLNIDIFLLGFFFLLTPAFLSGYICLGMIEAKRPVTNKEFLKGFRAFYAIRSPFYGALDIIRGILFAILATLGVSFVFSTIYPYIAGDEFITATNQLLDLYINSGSVEQIVEFLENSAELQQFYNLCLVVCLGFAGIFFIFRYCKYLLNMQYKMFSSVFGPRKSNYLFRRFWKRNRKDLLKDFCSCNWVGMVSIILSVVLAIVLCCVFGITAYGSIIGVCFGLIIASLFYPRYVQFIEFITDKYSLNFKNEFHSMADETLSSLNNATNLSQENKEGFIKATEAIEKLLNSIEETKNKINDSADNDEPGEFDSDEPDSNEK